MMEVDMATFEAKHDHTLMDVLLEDLTALAQHCFTCQDSELIEDTRKAWRHLKAEFMHHIHMEDGYFRLLSQRSPHLTTVLEQLSLQHHHILSMLEALGELLLGPVEEVVTQRSSFLRRWDELGQIWKEHSHAEWEMMASLR